MLFKLPFLQKCPVDLFYKGLNRPHFTCRKWLVAEIFVHLDTRSLLFPSDLWWVAKIENCNLQLSFKTKHFSLYLLFHRNTDGVGNPKVPTVWTVAFRELQVICPNFVMFFVFTHFLELLIISIASLLRLLLFFTSNNWLLCTLPKYLFC